MTAPANATPLAMLADAVRQQAQVILLSNPADSDHEAVLAGAVSRLVAAVHAAEAVPAPTPPRSLDEAYADYYGLSADARRDELDAMHEREVEFRAPENYGLLPDERMP